MTQETHARGPAEAGRLWRRNGLVWSMLVVLLALTWWLAYAPLGRLALPVALLIALAKAALVATLYMELKKESGLIRLAAVIGLVFVLVLFALTASDVVWRTFHMFGN